MKIGMIGLGRMGGNMARRLMRGGHQVVAFDRNPEAVAGLAREGATAATSLADVASLLDGPAIWWLMLPAGEITQGTIDEIAAIAGPGDTIIDGGNGHFKDDIRRAAALGAKGIAYLDAGVSGGVWGLERGYCLMIGGPAKAVAELDPLFATLAPGLGNIARTPAREAGSGIGTAELGYVHAGPAGAGHFAKMVHNGIEYGMMQAFAEGFHILKQRSADLLPAEERMDLNLADIAEVWRRGSVVSSWLLDLIADALAKDQSLSQFSGRVADSGEGRWTIEAAMDESVPVDVLAASLFARYRSRIEENFADQLLSAMRLGFGGHVETSK